MGQYEGRLGDDAARTASPAGRTRPTTTPPASSARTTTTPAASASTTPTTSRSHAAVREAATPATRSPADVETRVGDTVALRSRSSSSSATCGCARTSPASCSTCRRRSRACTRSAATCSTSTSTRRPSAPRGSARLHGDGARPAAGARARLLRPRRLVTTARSSGIEATTGHPVPDRDRPRLAARRHRPLRRRQPARRFVADLARRRARRSLHLRRARQLRRRRASSHPSTTNPPGDASCLTQQDFGRHREPNQRAATSSVAVLPRALAARRPVPGLHASRELRPGRPLDRSRATSRRTSKTPFASITPYEGGVVLRGAR